jgi:energy-coupling factor transporter ATP-binding protein EcfA2
MQQHPNPLSPIPSSANALVGKRIKHPRIAEVMSELEALIYPGSQHTTLIVCGPTGAGKTTLARYMVEAAVERAAIDMEQNAGTIPAIFVEAPSSGEDEFSWRLFYQQILAELGDDLDAPKAAYGIDVHSGRMVRPRGAGGNSLAALRTAAERGLEERNVQFLVVDEAAHIIHQTRNSHKLEIHLDTLKSLVNKCGTQMVLVGSYDLYPLMSLSGQLARRHHVLHFQRYRQDKPEDVRAFVACLNAFEKMLPDLWGGELTRYAEALQENTLGCIGTLSSVLVRAARFAKADGRWSTEALRRALLTEAQRDRILTEILEGEEAINPGLTRIMRKPPRQSSATSGRNAA